MNVVPLNRTRTLATWLTVFTLAAILICSFLYANWQKKKEAYLHQHSSIVATTYQASVEGYAVTAQFLVDEVIRKTDVIETFARGINGDLRARGQLFRLLAPTYDQLLKHGIRQLHFHTASGHSFLRFHALDKYGDPLFEVRPSVRIANTEQRPVHGFESGRIMSGFRYVFPLFDGEQHLGSVEASLTFRVIREAMMRIDPERDYLMVLHKDAIEDVVFSDHRGLYAPWEVNPGYFVEDPQLTLPDSPPLPSATVRALNNAMTEDDRVRTRMATGVTFTLAQRWEHHDWTMTFLPVLDVNQQPAAYIVSYAMTPYLKTLRLEFIYTIGLILLALVTAMTTAYLLWRSLVLKASEGDRFAAITNTVGEGIYVLDEAGVVTFVNPAFTELLEFTDTEVLGKIGHDLFHLHDINRQKTPLSQCPIYLSVAQGLTFEGEERFQTRSGSTLDVAVTSRPVLDKRGQPSGSSVTAFRDISNRIQAEKTLKKSADALQRNNADLARLGEIMAHHFQESTRRMTTFARVLQVNANVVADPDSRQAITYIDEQASRLSSLVRRAQRYLELEESIPGETTASEIRSLIHQALSVSVAADAELYLAADIPAIPLTEPRLSRIMSIVFDNCGHYRRDGSPLAIQITAVDDRESLKLRIADNGRGIDPAHRERVLELFTNLATGKNSGSGLALARRIMRLAGGDLYLDDGVDGGIAVVLMFNR